MTPRNFLSQLALAAAATMLWYVAVATEAESSQPLYQTVWKPQQRFGKRSAKEFAQTGIDSSDWTLSGNF
jgi:hypothetical protein